MRIQNVETAVKGRHMIPGFCTLPAKVALPLQSKTTRECPATGSA